MGDQNVQTMLGDCLELMPLIPDGSVDCVICDLPYGTTQNSWDSVISFDDLWAQYKRLVKPNGAIVLTAAQPFTTALIASNRKGWKQNLVWEKEQGSNFLNANRQHIMIHEDICIFSFGTPIYNPQMQKGDPYISKSNSNHSECYGTFGTEHVTVNDGSRYPKSILKFNRDTGLHPTQKPVALFAYLIRTYTNPGDLVLDNCAGSFTTGAACIQEGRRAILIEKDPTYYAKGCQRLRDLTPSLFAQVH